MILSKIWLNFLNGLPFVRSCCSISQSSLTSSFVYLKKNFLSRKGSVHPIKGEQIGPEVIAYYLTVNYTIQKMKNCIPLVFFICSTIYEKQPLVYYHNYFLASMIIYWCLLFTCLLKLKEVVLVIYLKLIRNNFSNIVLIKLINN